MSKDYEKGHDSLIPTAVDVDSNVDVDSSQHAFYDPSKESIWTRLGLSLESFKRAPGTTGYVAFDLPGGVTEL